MEKENFLSHWFELKAIQFDFGEGFRWASGIQSPIYVDNRRLLSLPEIRRAVVKALGDFILKQDIEFTHIAGVATGAIGYALLLAEEWEMPFFYVRPRAKSHGLKKQIEGICPSSAKVLLIEDLISTGESAMEAKRAIEDTGANVSFIIALFSYELPTAHTKFLTYKALFTFTELVSYLEKKKILNFEQIQALKEWHKKLKIEEYGKSN